MKPSIARHVHVHITRLEQEEKQTIKQLPHIPHVCLRIW